MPTRAPFQPARTRWTAPRDLLVLAVLADGPSHGYGIIKAVEERSEHDVLLDPANLYRCLRRMSADGWIDEVEARTADDRPPSAVRWRALIRFPFVLALEWRDALFAPGLPAPRPSRGSRMESLS